MSKYHDSTPYLSLCHETIVVTPLLIIFPSTIILSQKIIVVSQEQTLFIKPTIK